MSLGTKLQAVHSKVNTKLGTQDGTIVFRKHTLTQPTTFGKAYSANTNSDVTITAGVKVSRVKAYEVDKTGTLALNDVKFIVPGGLLSEDQLKAEKDKPVEIVYGSKTYGIVSYAPTEIISGVPVNWLVYARLRE